MCKGDGNQTNVDLGTVVVTVSERKNTLAHTHTNTQCRCKDEKRTHTDIHSSTSMHMHRQDYCESATGRYIALNALRQARITTAWQCVSLLKAALFILAALLSLKSDLSRFSVHWESPCCIQLTVSYTAAHSPSIERGDNLFFLWQVNFSKAKVVTKSHSKLPSREKGRLEAAKQHSLYNILYNIWNDCI